MHIEFTIKYPKAVMPAKAGIQENTLDAPVSSTGQAYQVRHDKVRVLFCRVNNLGERKVEIKRKVKDFDDDLQDEF